MSATKTRLAIGALVLLAGTCVLAAQDVTIVGTFDRHAGDKLYVKTDDGPQSYDVANIKLDPTLGKGDLVRVSYATEGGTRVADVVARVATVSVKARDNRAGVERLVVDDVETGSLASLEGKGDVEAEVMMTVADHVIIRTADPKFPVVAFRATRPLGSTEFREGELIHLRVPAPVVNDVTQVHTEPVRPTLR